MDAHSARAKFIDRLLFAVSLGVLGVGLWQCYGAWLLERLRAG